MTVLINPSYAKLCLYLLMMQFYSASSLKYPEILQFSYGYFISLYNTHIQYKYLGTCTIKDPKHDHYSETFWMAFISKCLHSILHHCIFDWLCEREGHVKWFALWLTLNTIRSMDISMHQEHSFQVITFPYT